MSSLLFSTVFAPKKQSNGSVVHIYLFGRKWNGENRFHEEKERKKIVKKKGGWWPWPAPVTRDRAKKKGKKCRANEKLELLKPLYLKRKRQRVGMFL